MLESRLKLLSGETGLSVAQKMADVKDSVRKAKVLKSKLFFVLFSTGKVSNRYCLSSFSLLKKAYQLIHFQLK